MGKLEVYQRQGPKPSDMDPLLFKVEGAQGNVWLPAEIEVGPWFR